MRTNRRIGNVPVQLAVDAEKIVYADGAEKDLLEIFKSKNPSVKIKAVLSNSPSWPMVYHLSQKRSALVDWYDFPKGARVLEVGAGCGAITEALVRRDIHVTALEIDPQRALVNAERNKQATNLEIVAQNIQDFTPSERFDYIICVGVLEYSGRYIKAEDPYLAFLQILRTFLKDEGTLLLAIENKLGVKYFAGAPEDHTGKVFDSLNNYPDSIGIKTFSRTELIDLLHNAEFAANDFYFPHPDYKLPSHIFSDELYPGNGIETPMSLFPTPTPADRAHLFSEQSLMLTLEKEKLYPHFANSFLVEARSSDKARRPQALAYIGQNNRDEKYAIGTFFNKSSSKDKIMVRKQNLHKAGKQHIQSICKNETLLSSSIAHDIATVLPVQTKLFDADTLSASYPFVNGMTLERLLLQAILGDSKDVALSALSSIFAIINSLGSRLVNPTRNDKYTKVFGKSFNSTMLCVRPGIVDLHLDNIIVSNGSLTLIDYEWVYDFYIPVDFIVGRILLGFFANKYSDLLFMDRKSLDLVVLDGVISIPKYIVEAFDLKKIDFTACRATEDYFQNLVHNRPNISVVKKKARNLGSQIKVPHLVSVARQYDSAKARVQELEKYKIILEKDIHTLHQTIAKLTDENQNYRSSPALRIQSKVHRVFKRK